jgi:hypothetical protein
MKQQRHYLGQVLIGFGCVKLKMFAKVNTLREEMCNMPIWKIICEERTTNPSLLSDDVISILAVISYCFFVGLRCT